MTHDTGTNNMVANDTATGPDAKTVGATPASEATVFVASRIHRKSLEYAQRVFKRVVQPNVDGWPLERCLTECDAALVRVFDYPAEYVAKGKRLKIIARNGTGYDSINLPACKEHGVIVTNVPGGNAPAVGELTIALALAVMRRVVETNNRIRSGEQLPSIDALSIGLRGKTVGLVGMGSIAYEAAKLFTAFQCPIIVYAPTSPPERWNVPSDQYPTPVVHTRAASLDELLQTADVVSLHCPLTASTRNMIGARELALMKTESVLINTSRGGMIDEDALAVALSTGQIYGAGLDVMAHEPAFGANLGALRDLPNVVILPHLGGSTEATTEMGCNEAIDIIRDYLDGKGARNRVA